MIRLWYKLRLWHPIGKKATFIRVRRTFHSNKSPEFLNGWILGLDVAQKSKYDPPWLSWSSLKRFINFSSKLNWNFFCQHKWLIYHKSWLIIHNSSIHDSPKLKALMEDRPMTVLEIWLYIGDLRMLSRRFISREVCK